MVNTPDALTRPLAAARAEVTSPAGGLLFVSGALTQDLSRVADQVKSVWRNVPLCIVPGAGVLSERGELEGTSAASGLLWSGGQAAPLSIGENAPPSALREAVASLSGGRRLTVALFPRSDFVTDMLEGVGKTVAGHRDRESSVCVFGAGTVGGTALGLTAGGEVVRGRVVGLAVQGLAPPLIESTAACRLLTPLREVQETASGLVLTIDGTPALDLLSSCMPEIRSAAQGGSQQHQPVLFVALSDPSSNRYVVRPVRGVDPNRRGVLVGPEVKPGMRVAIAVRDAATARAGVEATARSVSQQSMGAAPRFAIYLSCAGRGQGLYGAPDVEARILRQRFGELPIVGMHSAFEIIPWESGEARLTLYTSVLALFRSPS